MATYVFKAMDLTGGKATGEVEAESKQIVSSQLKARGLIVLEIADKHSSKELKLPFGNKIKPDALTIMTRRPPPRVAWAMPTRGALSVLEEQPEQEKPGGATP